MCHQCVVVQTDLEPLFDVTDLQSRRESAAITSQPVSKCGQLELAFAYDAPGRKMTVHVLQARDVPSKDRGGASHTQVRYYVSHC
jgi:synaptotagmin-14/16